MVYYVIIIRYSVCFNTNGITQSVFTFAHDAL